MNRITIDLTLNKAVVAVDSQTLFTGPLLLKRGNPEAFEVQFVQNSVVQELTTPSITIGIKNKATLGSGYDASANAFTQSGSGANTLYSMTVNCDTVEMGSDFTAKQEPSTLAMYLEVMWTVGGVTERTQLIPVTMENSLNRGNEAANTANAQLVTLTDAATINWAAPQAINVATVTLGGNRTLAITGKPGTIGLLIVKQDVTGSRTLALPAGSKTNGGGGISLTSAANSIDLLQYVYDGTNFLWTHFNAFA